MLKRLVALVLALMLLLSTVSGVAEATVLSCGDFRYVLLEDGTAKIVDCTDRGQTVTVPELVDGVVVTAIGERAFGKCFSAERIDLPRGLTTIAPNAFDNCFALRTLGVYRGTAAESFVQGRGLETAYLIAPEDVYLFGVLADGTAVVRGYTGQDTDLVIPSVLGGYPVSTIGADAFSGREELRSVTLPETLRTIEENAFTRCKGLESITLPEGLASVGNNAFGWCTGLKTIHLPLSLEKLGVAPLRWCTGLESITVAPEHAAFASVDGLLLRKSDGALLAYPAAREDEEVTLPAGVKSIAPGAFMGVRIRNLCLNSDLLRLDAGAFTECDSLTTIELPASLTEISEAAFARATSLRAFILAGDNPVYALHGPALVDTSRQVLLAYPPADPATAYSVPEGIVRIGNSAFAHSRNLETVQLPLSVTEVGVDAFADCSALARIDLPARLTKLGEGAFSHCAGLKEISLPDGLAEIEPYTFCGTAIEEIRVPAGVQRIGYWAFSGCDSLLRVELPDSVTAIDDYAFRDCLRLSVLNLPAAVRRIGNKVFDECHHLTLTVDSGSYAEEYALKQGLKYKLSGPPAAPESDFTWDGLADGTVTITGYTGQGGLVVVPATLGGRTVSAIEANAFANNMSLTGITLPDTVQSIGFCAFDGCMVLEEVGLPKGLTAIDSYAFSGCSELRSVRLPAGLSDLGEGVFGYCSGLEEIAVEPGCVAFAVMDGALIRTADMALVCYPAGRAAREFTTPQGVKSIATQAFLGADRLERITIGEGVEAIDTFAFAALFALRSVSLPASLTDVGSDNFSGCPMLEEIIVAPGNPVFTVTNNALVNTERSELVSAAVAQINGEYVVPDGIRSIGDWAFQHAFDMTSIRLPKSVEHIGYAAFFSAGLTEVTLPEGVTALGDYAFCACEKLQSVHLPASLTAIGDEAFGECNSATFTAPVGSYAAEWCARQNVAYHTVETEVSAPAAAVTPAPDAAPASDFTWEERSNGVIITGYTGNGGRVVIPATVENKPVIGIGENAFYWNSAVTAVVLPGTVKTIREDAFHGCQNMQELVLPEGLESIEDSAYAYCGALKTVTLPAGLRDVGVGVFSNDRRLEEIVVAPGNDVFTVTDGALINAQTGRLLALPSAYPGNTYVIPSGVTELAYRSIQASNKLERLVISEGVQRIESDAIVECENLKVLELPASLVTLELPAMFECGMITDIRLAEGNPNFRLCDGALVSNADDELAIVPRGRLRGEYTVPDGVRSVGPWVFEDADLRVINLPASVENLGSFAFSAIPNLQPVALPAGMTRIPDGLFYDSGITSVELPKGVESIGYNAFRSTDISRIELPASLREVNGYAFADCDKLTEIVLPDGVETLAYGVFEGCDKLETVILPASVTYIGQDTFSSCPALTVYAPAGSYAETYCKQNGVKVNAVTVTAAPAAEPLATSSVEDFLWEILDDRTLRLTKYVGNGGVVVIPGEVLGSAVTEVGSDAFENNQDVTEVVVPESVQVIDTGAFAGCSNLRKVTLPRHMDSIGFSAFRDCTALEEVVMPATLRWLAGQAFEKCRSLKSITLPEGIRYIDSSTFYFCTSLTSIVVPEGVERILGYAFAYCRSLTSVELPSTLTELGDSVFTECSVLPFVTLPDGLERIGNRTFENCPELFRLNLPASLKEIGDRAFANCPKLVVEAPEESYAQQYCFKYNVNMVVLLGGGGSGAPEAAPESDFVWETLEDGSVCITGYEGNGGEVIVPDALGGCPVTAIGNYAFYFKAEIARIVLPQSLRSIGDGAFSNCAGLEEIILPDGLESIGVDVFYCCYALKSIRLPAGLRSLGAGCFSYCPALTEIAVDPANPVFIVADGAVVDTSTRTLLAYPPAREATELTTPAGVESIANYTFEGCGQLQHIVVGEGVREIGMNAFACCDGLVDISLPSTFTDATGPFLYNCRALRDVTVHADNPVYAVVDHALYNTRDAELVFLPYSQVGREFTLPEGTRSIGAFAFDGYTNLEVIHLPRSLERVGDYALSNIMYLQPLTLPEGVREIGEGAFYGSGMTGITLPAGLERIGNYAFCASELATIVVPEGVREIGYGAFRECPSLTEVTLPAGVESIGENAFAECPQLTLRVPDGSYAARYCIENGLNCVIE